MPEEREVLETGEIPVLQFNNDGSFFEEFQRLQQQKAADIGSSGDQKDAEGNTDGREAEDGQRGPADPAPPGGSTNKTPEPSELPVGQQPSSKPVVVLKTKRPIANVTLRPGVPKRSKGRMIRCKQCMTAPGCAV